MSNPLYGFIIFAFSCVLSVSAAELGVLSSRETLFQCQPGSVLAKDVALSEAYHRLLAIFTSLQGTAEMTRELRALADWACLKKGKAPAKFHVRLKNLVKKVNASEWLTDDEKALFGDVCRRLRKKKRQLVAPVVIASLAVMVTAVAISVTRRNKFLPNDRNAVRPGVLGAGGNPQQGQLDGSPTGASGGIGQNDLALFVEGHPVSTSQLGHDPYAPSAPPLEH